MKDIILQLDNVSFSITNKGMLQKREKIILQNLKYDFERSRIFGITGESGSGKTTLAKLIAGIVKGFSGRKLFNYKKDWSNSPSSPVQILFQNDGYLLNPNRKIIDILAEAYQIKHNNRGNFKAEIDNLFSTFALSDSLLDSKGSKLSGGEQQRIALARILIVEPELLILDEPFSSQDTEARSLLIELIKNINKSSGTTVICISHDIYALQDFVDEIIILSNGQIAESGLATDIFKDPESSYTKFLLSAQSLNLSKEDIFTYLNNGKNKRN